MKGSLFILLVLELITLIYCDPCKTAEHNAHLPIDSSCTRFIICEDYKETSQAECRPGTYFHGSLGYCSSDVPPGCDGGIVTTPCTCSSCTTPCGMSSTTEEPETGSSSTTPLGIYPTTERPGTSDSRTGSCASCNKEYLGKLVPVVGDCSKYCVCQYYDHQELNIIMPCPGGLHFSPTLQTCDYPLRAGCKYAL